mmetsp:Transcript_13357/g.32116  ORF Transcript_13357/g.32116 Transcript_13357/m.32116 type:complete len:139 (+) Transcript_13357:223-639(+)
MRSLSSRYRRLSLQTGSLARQQPKGSSHESHRRWRSQQGPYGNYQHHSFSTLSSSFREPILRSNDEKDLSQRRNYHSTPKNEMVLYGTIILVTTFGYVAYRKWNGLPLKPESVSESQSAYRKMEEDRQRRNEKHSNKQ